ncbi:MAG: methionine aminotransferase [Bacteroidota bacterium]|nr:methionine aminotransferase [Bacteroidota bacterium]
MITTSIKSKLPNTGQTIFTVMSVLAKKHKAINLGQGFPDFDMNEDLISLVHKAMKDGHNQYVHMNGLIELRETIADKIFYLYQSKINPNKEICITPGGTYAIYTALTSLLKPGDEVIVFEPAYDSYIPNIKINGAIPVLIPLTYPEYKIDWNLVKDKINPQTRMIILNSPHNPTGTVIDKNDIEELRKIVFGTDILILSDEVYEHIIFDGIQHESILKYPDLFARSFIAFSFGKVYNCTGWKIGYCIAPPTLMKEFLKVHQYNCFSCNSPLQYALAQYLQNKNEYLQLGNSFQKKRDYFNVIMAQTKFKAIPSHGSYFQLYNYSEVSNESEIEFAKRLTRNAGVTSIPVSAFYKEGKDNKVLRFCFAKKESTLNEAVNRLINYFSLGKNNFIKNI